MGIVHHFNHGTPFNVPSPQWPRRGVLATTSPPVQIALFFPTGSAGSEPVGGWFSHPSSASSLDSRRHELYYSAASKLNHLRDPHDPGQLNKANPTSPISEAKKRDVCVPSTESERILQIVVRVCFCCRRDRGSWHEHTGTGPMNGKISNTITVTCVLVFFFLFSPPSLYPVLYLGLHRVDSVPVSVPSMTVLRASRQV